jgi:hypothetical protein
MPKSSSPFPPPRPARREKNLLIEHLVLFKVKSDASKRDADEMLRRLRALKDAIPEIKYLSCGENFSERARGFTHGLVVRFDGKEDLNAYQVHPVHQAAVVEAIRPIVEPDGVLALDYEI